MGTRKPAGAGAAIPVEPSRLISYREGMRMLNISESSLHRLIQQGEFEVCPAPKRNKLVRASVEAYIARQVNKANGKHKKPPDSVIPSSPRAFENYFRSLAGGDKQPPRSVTGTSFSPPLAIKALAGGDRKPPRSVPRHKKQTA